MAITLPAAARSATFTLLAVAAGCNGSGSGGGALAPFAHTVAGTHARGVRPDVPTCSGLGSKAFVGGVNGNVAHGADSGVLSGISNQACDIRSGIGVGQQNAVSSAGGTSTDSFIAAGHSNIITGPGKLSFIGAGNTNVVEQGYSAIGAGVQNTNDAIYSTIGGGQGNMIGSADVGSGYDLIGAGASNTILANYSTIGGGQNNEVFADYAFLGGGATNRIGTVKTTQGAYSALGGGLNNAVQGEYAFLGGGFKNQANGIYSTVPGGATNVATGTGSFAAGDNAWAAYNGSFVWSDASGGTQVKATADNQFVARATGGFIFYTNAVVSSGAKLASGSGTWASLSDRTAKTAVIPIDDGAVLQKVASLPISRWSYISEGHVRHIGPMAQDFYRAFGLGPDDKHVTTIDEEGVAYAAIQALQREMERVQHTVGNVAALQSAHRRNLATLAALHRRVAALEFRLRYLTVTKARMQTAVQ